jgi:hypothetical protein
LNGTRVLEFGEALPEYIETLLKNLGQGLTLSVPYDTAWLAQLDPEYGFGEAYQWLNTHQNDDGSWGSGISHYHDRIICTLAALIALKKGPSNSATDSRIQRALNYIKTNIYSSRVGFHETINFTGLATYLLSHARELGLDTPLPDIYQPSPKLARLRHRPDLWGNHSIAYSLECFQPKYEQVQSLFASNGSIASSPAATIAVMLNSNSAVPEALAYLRQYVSDDGGMPTVAPINLFEITWSLHHLISSDAISPEHPEVHRLLDFDWQHWNHSRGQSWGNAFKLENLDDSASGFLFLRWGHYPVSVSTFAWYEQEDRFFCYPDETDPSLHAHLKLLQALKTEYRQHPWIDKINNFITTYHTTAAPRDKWHISPYYIYATAIPALHTINDSLMHTYAQYALNHQNADGGWGFYGVSTSEETAYALKALIYYHTHVAPVETSILHRAAQYLAGHYNTSYIACWIGKCLYTPYNVIHAAVLGAMHSYLHLGD